MDFPTGFGHALTIQVPKFEVLCHLRTCDAMCLWCLWYLAAASHRTTCCWTPEIYSNIPYIGWSHWFVLVVYRRFRMSLCGSMLGPESVSRYLWSGRGLRQFEKRIRQHPFAWGTGTRDVFGYGMVYIAKRPDWGARMPQMWWFNGFPTKPSGLRLVRFKH